MTMESELLHELLQINVFKIGEYTLKTGGLSPIYIDLRSIIGYPKILRMIAQAIRDKQRELDLQIDSVCGVPYTSLPTASAFSVLFDVPIILKRKEAKSYGTHKLIEGIIKTGDKCLIIEDVVVSGSSIIDTARCLRKEGLEVTDCIAVLDRKQGAEKNLPKEGIAFHPLFNVNEMFEMYCKQNEVSDDMVLKVQNYLKENSYVPINTSQCPVEGTDNISFIENGTAVL